MKTRQRRKLAKSLDCTHLYPVDDGFCGHYECELKHICDDGYCNCKGFKFSRKELKRILKYRSTNRRSLKKAMKLSGHTIKSYECKHYGI